MICWLWYNFNTSTCWLNLQNISKKAIRKHKKLNNWRHIEEWNVIPEEMFIIHPVWLCQAEIHHVHSELIVLGYKTKKKQNVFVQSYPIFTKIENVFNFFSTYFKSIGGRTNKRQIWELLICLFKSYWTVNFTHKMNITLYTPNETTQTLDDINLWYPFVPFFTEHPV